MTYTFDVIDRRTKKVADPRAVIKEFHSPELTESHGSFAVAPNGELLVLDECGNYAYLDDRLFTAKWVDET